MQELPSSAPLLTPQEAAAFLGVSLRMLNYYRIKGIIPAIQLGGTFRYDAVGIVAHLRSQPKVETRGRKRRVPKGGDE